MASEIVADQSDTTGPSLTGARDKAIYYAAAESSALANMLRKQNNDTTEFDFVLPGALMRIEALSTAVCQLLGSKEEHVIAEEYEIVFGEKLEVSHG
ncbi:MAG: hypothetical protein IV107_03950 [Paucibacter sp.]|nr:hypothetical protein [Roseateles sp.]